MSDDRIFLWETGRYSGAVETRDRALEAAAERLDGDAEALVEEAEMVITAGAGGSLVPEHRRTGPAWRGHLQDGEPVWEPARAVAP